MTDPRNLLENAAKACGIHLHHWFPQHGGVWMTSSVEGGDPDSSWAPHTNDSDSAHMRTKLRMDTQYARYFVKCIAMYRDAAGKSQFAEAQEVYADHDSPDAALRLCALRCAAMIGERI